MAAMKRIAAAPLWFLVGWFVGSAVAWTFGLGAFLAPITALLLAGVVVGDPWGIIWPVVAWIGLARCSGLRSNARPNRGSTRTRV